MLFQNKRFNHLKILKVVLVFLLFRYVHKNEENSTRNRGRYRYFFTIAPEVDKINVK